MLYPIEVKLEGRKCLVVGGGSVAERKVRSLLECGAAVLVVSPALTPGLRELAGRREVRHLQREYAPIDLTGAFLVIAATSDPGTNRRVAEDCHERGVLVNVVDDPEYCSFYVPAVVRRGDLCISVSTSGKSPLLARRLREELEDRYGPEYARLLEIMGEVRQRVLAEVPEEQARRAIFERLVKSNLLELIRQGKDQSIKERVAECISWPLD